MKTAALIICIAALSVTAAQAEQSSCGVCGTRQTHPSDVKLENPPALENGESFSMILYGDPQTYTKNTFSQPIFELMTAWTAAHKDALKIKAVLCTGDIVERNDTLTAFPLTRNDINGDAQSFLQWEAAARRSRASTGKFRTYCAQATTTTATKARKTATHILMIISRFQKIPFGATPLFRPFRMRQEL